MTVNAEKAFGVEAEFLSGMETNFETAKGRQFRGTIWQRARTDDEDRLRALLASNRIYDRERLRSLPANRRLALHGFERRFLFGKRRTGVAIASVLSPLSHYASAPDAPGPPVGLGELLDHVRQLVGEARVPHVVGVCSPTGFSDETKNAKIEMPNVTVVLVEPDGYGGWRTQATTEGLDPRVLKIFDPEGANEKLERVRRVIDDMSAELLTGGLSASALAARTNLPQDIVQHALEKVASGDPELRVSAKGGEFLLYRGAGVQRRERGPMNVIDRIRKLLSGEGDEAAKINLLAERRAALAQRRDRIYDDIAKLERREADLFAQGKAATSHVPRRRLAAQLAQLRKDIARQNATAAMLNKQIDIISTDIHNLTLIQQGEMAELPDSATLTEDAVRAEEMLETLRADAELVSQLETGMEETLSSEEELAILREFEETEPRAATAQPSRASEEAKPNDEPGRTHKEGELSRSQAEPPRQPSEQDSARETAEPSSDSRREKARPADAEPT